MDAGAAGSLTGAAELFRFWVFPDCTFLDISNFLDCFMASSLGSETVHAIQKLWLIYCFQYLLYCQLYYFILIGHNSQWPQLSVRFGNVYPPCRKRLVRFVPQSLYKVCDVALKMLSVFFLGHLVNSYCLLAVQFPVTLFQQFSIYEVIQACEFWSLCCR